MSLCLFVCLQPWNMSLCLFVCLFTAMEHVSMVRRHAYENVRKQSTEATPTGATPTGSSSPEPAFMKLARSKGTVVTASAREQATPSKDRVTPTGLVISPSKKRGYENVQLDTPQSIPRAHTVSGHAYQARPPHYEEVAELKPCPPVRTSSCSVQTSTQPLSPTSSIMTTPLPLSGHRNLEQSLESVVPIQHQTSATGVEYAVVPSKQHRKKMEGRRPQQQQQQQHVIQESCGEVGGAFPPLPLRAFERMSSRENLADFHEDSSSRSDSTSPLTQATTTSSAPPTASPSAPPTVDRVNESEVRVSQMTGPFSVVNVPALAEVHGHALARGCGPEVGEPAPDPDAPQPYEVATTTSLSPSTPVHEETSKQHTSRSPEGGSLGPAMGADVDPPEVDPPYEEIENEEDEITGEKCLCTWEGREGVVGVEGVELA